MNESHDTALATIANLIASCDKAALNEAFKSLFGEDIIHYFKEVRPKRHHFQFDDFRLVRFARKDSCLYIGKRDKPSGCKDNFIYKIETVRDFPLSGQHGTVCTINDEFLFTIRSRSYAMSQKLAISCLHKYLDIHKRNHASKKRRKMVNTETKEA